MKTTLILFVLVTALVGCGTPRGNKVVPSSDIQFDMRAGTGKLLLPKNAKANSIFIQNTNSTVRIEGLEVENSPEIVGQSYAGAAMIVQLQNQRIEALAARIDGLLQFLANKAGQAYGFPITVSTNR